MHPSLGGRFRAFVIGVSMLGERNTLRFLFIVSTLIVLMLSEVQAQPDISPSDTSHNFGLVGVGLESDWGLVLANSGNAALVISAVTPSLPEFTVPHPAFPKTIPPGDSLIVNVVFQPAAVGDVSGTVEVVSNDPDEGILNLKVTGHGTAVVHMTVSDTSVPAGAQFFFPIHVDDVSGLGITSVEMRLVFDNSLLSARGASVVGTIAELWNLQVDADNDQIEIHMSGFSALTGSGVLVYIDSYVSDDAPPGESTPVVLVDVTFNGGDPVALTQNGLLTVASYTLSGVVIYYKHVTPVDSVLLSLQGGVVDSTWTSSTGSYQFDTIPGGRDYSVTPSKQGGVRTAINSYDAALVLRYNIGMLSLDPMQLLVADVTGNGTVGPYDVAHILQFRVGKIDQFPIGKEWLFIPEKMDYDSLSSDLTHEDYTALAYGDVSGNWSGSGAGKGSLPCPDSRIGLPDVFPVLPGEEITLPIMMDQADGVVSVDLELMYDSKMLNCFEVRTTSFTSNFLLQFYDDDGVVHIAMAGSEALQGSGELVRIVFQVSSYTRHDAEISFEISASVNEGRVVADRHPGRVVLSAMSVPDGFELKQNYPNPFNPTTSIWYSVAHSIPSVPHVRVAIYNTLGQEIETLVDEVQQQPGSYNVLWTGKDRYGNDVPSGIYYCRMSAGSFVSAKKMLLLR